jgi:tetratricopeptide (TPR) repeat protein
VHDHPEDAGFVEQLAESQANLGMLLDQLGETAGAEQSLRAAIDLLRSVPASRNNSASFARNLAIVYNNLSYVLRSRDATAAEGASREAVKILEGLVDESAEHPEFQDDLALCYNNLAALESQNQRWDNAIDWHQRAIKLQEQMTRKAPGVVRHRSELAVSWNNLGVVFFRAKRPAEADSAFEQARSLLTNLVRDFPDQLAYSSSWAALLNNQAMALAEAGRHEDALPLYPVAIEAQRICWQQMPDSMSEPLSKMYYNYGQSLRHTGQFSAAVQAAVERRDVWQGNGQRLFGVAVELAEIARASGSALSADETQKLHLEIITALAASRDAGWLEQTNLAEDQRFSFLREYKQFEQLIARTAHRSPENESAMRVTPQIPYRAKN